MVVVVVLVVLVVVVVVVVLVVVLVVAGGSVVDGGDVVVVVAGAEVVVDGADVEVDATVGGGDVVLVGAVDSGVEATVTTAVSPADPPAVIDSASVVLVHPAMISTTATAIDTMPMLFRPMSTEATSVSIHREVTVAHAEFVGGIVDVVTALDGGVADFCIGFLRSVPDRLSEVMSSSV